MSGGRYIDRMEKREGTWKIAARKCLVEWGSKNIQVEGMAEVYAAVGMASEWEFNRHVITVNASNLPSHRNAPGGAG